MYSLRALAQAGLLFCLTLSQLSGSDELNRQLKRIFDSKELTLKRFGPARWTENGSSYTIVERSPVLKDADDIVQYETASGKRTVLVSASALIPRGGAKPLSVDDYRWSADGKRPLGIYEY